MEGAVHHSELPRQPKQWPQLHSLLCSGSEVSPDVCSDVLFVRPDEGSVPALAGPHVPQKHHRPRQRLHHLHEDGAEAEEEERTESSGNPEQ